MRTKIFWNYSFENKSKLKKLYFLDKLKKIGKTYTFNQKFFNINYYSTPDNKKKKLYGEKYMENIKHIYLISTFN